MAIMAQATSNCTSAEGLHFSAFHYTIITHVASGITQFTHIYISDSRNYLKQSLACSLRMDGKGKLSSHSIYTIHLVKVISRA